MEEEFYCSLKLVSGEEVFSLIYIDQNEEEDIIVMQNPVVMKIIENNKGHFVIVKPWMEIPDDDFYFIKADKVITMTEIKDKNTINLYNNYLNSDDSNSNNEIDGKVKISKQMGYISSVDSAREKLEEIYKNSSLNEQDKKDL